LATTTLISPRLSPLPVDKQSSTTNSLEAMAIIHSSWPARPRVRSTMTSRLQEHGRSAAYTPPLSRTSSSSFDDVSSEPNTPMDLEVTRAVVGLDGVDDDDDGHSMVDEHLRCENERKSTDGSRGRSHVTHNI
jgi:hypothetical protein